MDYSLLNCWVILASALWLSKCECNDARILFPVTPAWTATSTPTLCDSACCTCRHSVICRPNTKCPKELEISETSKGGVRIPPSAWSVTIDGFQRVKMTKSSLKHSMHLAKLQLSNIGQLQLDEQAMAKAPCFNSNASDASNASKNSLSIRILNCSIDGFPKATFTGDIVDIEVRQSKISVIRSESFSKLTCLKRLQIDDNIIDRIEPMGFYQPWLDYRQISHLVPATKSGSDWRAYISNNRIGFIEPYAFYLDSPLVFEFINNTVSRTDGYAFNMSLAGSIRIEGNDLRNVNRRSFYGIGPLRHDRRDRQLVFVGNTLHQFDDDALKLRRHFDVSVVNVSQVQLAEECDCYLRDRAGRIVSDDITEDVYNVTDALMCRNGTTYINLINATSHCTLHPLGGHHRPHHPRLGTILALAMSILLVLAIGGFLFFWLRIRRKRQKTDAQPEQTSATHQEKQWRMVVPDVRLYKETELQVEVEYATPLEECLDDGADDSLKQTHPLD